MESGKKAIAEGLILGNITPWSVANPTDTGLTILERWVTLETLGDNKDGYHFIMSPEG